MPAWGEINVLLPSGLFQRDIKEREIDYIHCMPEMIVEALNAGSAFPRHCPVKSKYWCCFCSPSLHSILPHMYRFKCKQADYCTCKRLYLKGFSDYYTADCPNHSGRKSTPTTHENNKAVKHLSPEGEWTGNSGNQDGHSSCPSMGEGPGGAHNNHVSCKMSQKPQDAA